MHNNPYLNGSDADESVINTNMPQSSDASEHLQPNGGSSSTYQRNEKHALYIDDYDKTADNPPSYHSATQVSIHHPDSMEGIPLDPYHANPPTEPETAPLMQELDEFTTMPISLPGNQTEVSPNNPSDNKLSKLHQCSLSRVILGFAIFVFGITLMATALATINCYSQCEAEEECNQCQAKLHKGLMAAGFSFFILTSLCIIWKVIKFTVFR
ncbi:hypothetical protein BD408DRAFT_429765 [Parasitella parasitica]|nr:hypothetical protein BD408DRAFT_429765 [Parasitella parasitica]